MNNCLKISIFALISSVVLIGTLSVVAWYFFNEMNRTGCGSEDTCGCYCGDCPFFDDDVKYNISEAESEDVFEICGLKLQPGIESFEACSEYILGLNCELNRISGSMLWWYNTSECYHVTDSQNRTCINVTSNCDPWDCHNYDSDVLYSEQIIAHGRPYMVKAFVENEKEKWIGQCVGEHASIASFSKFAIDLLVVGAPLDMIKRANDASNDEIRHTQIACEIAGIDESMLSLPEHDVTFSKDLKVVSLSAAIEGCIHESVASYKLMEDAVKYGIAQEIELMRKVAGIAEDEFSHAQIAWDFIFWAAVQDNDIMRIFSDDTWWEKIIKSEVPDIDSRHKDQIMKSKYSYFH